MINVKMDSSRSKDWIKNYRLGDNCKIKHGFAYKGEFMTTEKCSGPIVVNIVNFRYTGGFRFNETKIQRYTGKYPKEFELSPGDILVVMTCQTPNGEILGVPGTIPNDDEVYLHNQRMGLVVIDNKDKLDKRFLYWLFLSSDFNHYLFTTASGAKILHTSPGRIEDYRYNLPPIGIQKNIATMLDSYNDLIEINYRRIRLLEEIAQLIYREWFVNFRFPGHENVKMVESEVGPIPEGWDIKKLSDICSIVMGQSPKSEYYNEKGEGLPFHQGITNFGQRFPSDSIFCTVENRTAEKGDILFSVRAPVGRINIANKKLIIGRGLSAIRSNTGDQEFIFQQLKNIFTDDDMIGGGSIFNAVTKDDMYNIKIIQPSIDVRKLFKLIMEPLFKHLEVLILDNSNLRQTRDLLLPRLISGEIDVSELNIIVSTENEAGL